MKKWVYHLLIVVFSGVFLVSGGVLLCYYLESRAQSRSYDQLAALVAEVKSTAPTQSPEEQALDLPVQATEPEDIWMTVTDPETGKPVQLLPEYAQLYTMNNDLVGWIQLPGTKLDYPVMQTPQAADYYLKRDFYQKYSSHGCIYAEEECNVTASDNVTLYGHFMKDGSMFASLGEYKSQSYWQANPLLYFDTLQQRSTYEIFAVFVTTASEGEGFYYHTFVEAQTQQEYDDFVATCKEISLYDTGITPRYGERLLTLSTCEYTRTNGRLVVVARCKDAR